MKGKRADRAALKGGTSGWLRSYWTKETAMGESKRRVAKYEGGGVRRRVCKTGRDRFGIAKRREDALMETCRRQYAKGVATEQGGRRARAARPPEKGGLCERGSPLLFKQKKT